MCDPITITTAVIATASLATNVVGDIQKNKAEKNRAKATVAAADASAKDSIGQLSLRGVQEQQSTGQSILAVDRQARSVDAQARVSAGEAGVAGASVDAILGDVSRQDAQYRSTANQNLGNELDQINAEKQGVRTQAQNQKNLAPFPSNLATGVTIAGQGLNFASDLIRITHPK